MIGKISTRLTALGRIGIIVLLSTVALSVEAVAQSRFSSKDLVQVVEPKVQTMQLCYIKVFVGEQDKQIATYRSDEYPEDGVEGFTPLAQIAVPSICMLEPYVCPTNGGKAKDAGECRNKCYPQSGGGSFNDCITCVKYHDPDVKNPHATCSRQ